MMKEGSRNPQKLKKLTESHGHRSQASYNKSHFNRILKRNLAEWGEPDRLVNLRGVVFLGPALVSFIM